MTPQEFCYWLQGYFELSRAIPNDGKLYESQIKMIHEHLQLVFKKITDKNTAQIVIQGKPKDDFLERARASGMVSDQALLRAATTDRPLSYC